MSTLPIELHVGSEKPARSPISMSKLAAMKEHGQPITMVTAYDHPSASVVDAAGVDMILVGDSAAMVVLGHDSTVPITMDEMIMLSSAVRRGAKTPFIVGDMPFGSYEASNELAVANAQRFIKEAGCDAIKLEGGGTSSDRAAAIVSAGIPVVGHIGLTPQTATALGGYKAQGKTTEAAQAVIADAERLDRAGCFAIVIECVPAAVTDLITQRVNAITIGIGAGPATSGQVLVYHDLLGLREGRDAKFVRRYADLRQSAVQAVANYVADVQSGNYPGPEHVYAIEPGELSGVQRSLSND